MPWSTSAGTIGSVPPQRDEQRPSPDHVLERVARELHRRLVGRDEARRRRAASSSSSAAPSGAASRSEPLDRRRDRVDALSRREPDGEVRLRRDREHGVLQPRLAAEDAVHVDGRLGRTCGGRTRSAAAGRRRRALLRAARRRRTSARASSRAPRPSAARRRRAAARADARRAGGAGRAPASAHASRSAPRSRTRPSGGRARRSAP